MDITAYYYNNGYNISSQVPSYEFYQTTNDGQLGTYEGQLSLYEEQVNSYDDGEDDAFKDPNSIPLPQELTNMFKPLECELCGVTVICHASAFTHYEGKTHIKNVNAYMKEHYNVYGSLKVKKERFTPVRCDVCNIELTSKIVYQQHFSGKQHLKNLKKKQYNVPTTQVEDLTCGDDNLLKDLPPPPPPPKLSDYVCEICGISTNTEQQLIFHKNGQKHKKKLAKLNESRLDNALNAFYGNEWPGGSENNFGKMMAGNGANVLDVNGPSLSFIENPDMDYPLQFNDFPEPCNETNITITNEELEFENKNDETKIIASSEPCQVIIPTSLEEKTSEISVDLGIENEKLLASTGIFLRTLSVVSQTNNLKDCHNDDRVSVTGDILNDNKTTSDANQHSANVSEKCQDSISPLLSNSENNDNLKVTKPIDNMNIEEPKAAVTEQSSLEKPDEACIHSTEKTTKLAETSKIIVLNNFQKGKEDLSQVVIPARQDSETSLGKQPGNSCPQSAIVLESNDHDSKLDQVLTKLAIEEIEKESIHYGKTRVSKKGSAEEFSNSYKESDKSKYKYDKAGYRINEEIGKNQVCTENDYDYRRKPLVSKGNGYRSDRYGNRYYPKWNGYDRWNYSNKFYNNYIDYSYRYRHDRSSDYNKGYKNSNYDEYKKRKRDKRYSSDEEERNSKLRRNRRDDKKYRSSSQNKKRRSSSRSRRRRKSYSTGTSYSSRSRSSTSSEGEHFKKSNKSSKSNARRRDKVVKDKDYRSSRKHRSDNSDSESNSSRSSSLSNNHDYKLDKDGLCEKQHRCEKAYVSCPHKHKEPFKHKLEKLETGSIKQEETENSWNPEPPINHPAGKDKFTAQVKSEKVLELAAKVDPALSAYWTSSGTYYCKYCIVSTKSNELFREHLQTPKHTLLVKFKNKI